MLKPVDDFLNNITMYRLVLYFLIVLGGVGEIYSLFGVLPFAPLAYLFSFVFILFVCFVSNWIFAKVYKAPTNIESFWISGLILGLIVSPPKTSQEVIFLGWASLLAMASKYIFAIGKKHLFNPVAASVLLTAFLINGSATWWVGTASMLPVVVIGGFLIVRKIRRWDLVLSFLGVAIATIFVSSIFRGTNSLTSVSHSLVDAPMIFFAAIMLTEPLTTPPTRQLRIIYGAIVGFLFSPFLHVGSLYTTPEMALVLGNIFSYLVSPKYKLLLTLQKKIQLSPDTFDFIFSSDEPIKFTPGQYMEFTFDHPHPDDRGNRRYLSLASSPTESNIRLGIKFGNPPSSYKRSLLTLTPSQKITAGQLIGDFTLPEDKTKKLAFIAGGIGITPYRSILKYLIDNGDRRDIVLVYSAHADNEFVYKDVLTQAQQRLGTRVVYNASATQGHFDVNKMMKAIPDFRERTFYISGSHGMVMGFENLIKQMGVAPQRIIVDYFPGFV